MRRKERERESEARKYCQASLCHWCLTRFPVTFSLSLSHDARLAFGLRFHERMRRREEARAEQSGSHTRIHTESRQSKRGRAKLLSIGILISPPHPSSLGITFLRLLIHSCDRLLLLSLSFSFSRFGVLCLGKHSLARLTLCLWANVGLEKLDCVLLV